MPLPLRVLLVIGLAAAVHIDWHLARPTHHRLSVGWSAHWVLGAIVFAIAGWIIARFPAPFRTAAWITAAALFVGQVVEPFLEVLVYEGRVGYSVSGERWGAFAQFVAAGAPALILTLLLQRARRTRSAALG